MTIASGQASSKEKRTEDRPAPAKGREPGAMTVTRAHLTLYWERVWPGLLPVLSPLFLLNIASLFGLWRATPAFLHWIALAAVAGVTAWAARKYLWDIEWPTRREALSRLEEDGAAKHAPLQALEDAPFGAEADDPFWRAHQEDMRKRARAARLKKPHATIDRRDPLALRYGALGLLAVALVAAGDERTMRLAEGYRPSDILREGVSVADLWIEPPAYTGKATIYLLRAGDQLGGVRDQVNAPEGSTIVAQINSARRFTLSLQTETETLDGANSEQVAGDAKRATLIMKESGVVRFRLAGQEGKWPIGLIPDEAPTVTFTETPTATDDARLSLALNINDDYGVAEAALEMRLDPDQERSLDAPSFDQSSLNDTRTVKLDGLAGPTGKRNFALDLQADPWAGLNVFAKLIVKDGAGQSGATEIAEFRLPEREFFNPLAKAVIEQRQTLAVAAKNWPKAGRSFDALTLAPEEFYETSSDYLLIRTAFWRIMKRRGEDFSEAVEDFWPLALQLEDEALELARRRLDAAEEALREALERGASDSEISNLVEELREAMNQYLQALAQSGQPIPSDGQAAEQMNQSDLDQMLDSIRDLAQSGAQNAARQALSDLENILNNLRLSQQSGQEQQGQGQPGQGGQPGEGQPGGAGQAGDLIGRQRDLSNRSFEQGRAPGGSGQGLAGEQNDLAGDLNNLRGALSERAGSEGDPDPNGAAGRAFDDAAREMRRAEQALQADNFDAANTAMERAIESLRSGAETLAEQAGEQARQARGNGPGQQRGPAYDPLGRPIGANSGGDNVDVPDNSDYQRARDVLKELRKRLSDGERTEDEIEYLERLLERF